MTSEEILLEKAEIFMDNLVPDIGEPDGAETFNDSLISAIIPYYEAVDRLAILYKVLSLVKDELEQHEQNCQKENPSECQVHEYWIKCVFFVEQEIRQLIPDYDSTLLRPTVNVSLARNNLVQLAKYPESAKVYQDALNKLGKDTYDRNLLDDLRLCLELLLKEVLGNSKRLESQKDALGEYLKRNDCSKEISNMVWQLLDYYAKYQNDKVKHADKYRNEEVELLINLSSSFIAFILLR